MVGNVLYFSKRDEPTIDMRRRSYSDQVFANSVRELRFVIVSWTVFCVWVVGYCGVFAYQVDAEELDLVFGFPSWVFWGIAVPWVAATGLTIFFALKVMREDPLGPEGGGGDGD